MLREWLRLAVYLYSPPQRITHCISIPIAVANDAGRNRPEARRPVRKQRVRRWSARPLRRSHDGNVFNQMPYLRRCVLLV